MSKSKLPRIKSELLQSNLSRPDWTISAGRNNSLLHLDKNENTDETYIELLKNVITDVCLEDINQYPDCSVLYHKIARELNIPADNILLGAGSDGVIRYAFETFVSRGDAVVYTDPSFAMYSVYSQMYGAIPCRVGYMKSNKGLSLDIDLFLKKIHDSQPTLVCLPNPDSPTGTLVSEELLVLIIEAAEKVGAAVLIDEAYYPYSEYTVLPLIGSYSNLILTRTFSKAWGLAGARVGYAVANNDLIGYMHKVRPMYEIGALSAAIVAKAMNYENEMLTSVRRLNEGKNYFKREMEQIGFRTLCSHGNFQHVAFGKHASVIHEQLKNIAIYRQDFLDTVLEGFSRFSSTTPNTFKKIVTQINSVLKTSLQLA